MAKPVSLVFNTTQGPITNYSATTTVTVVNTCEQLVKKHKI